MLFSKKPGMHERHLQRQYNNPLFKNIIIEQQDIHLAQQKDEQAIALFIADFKTLVQRAVAFDANVDADVMLKLKEDLDKSYEQCSGLANDQTEIKEMIKRLLKIIMDSMWNSIGNDPQAKEKLEMEEQARTDHFALLEYPLVADLLHPESIIAKDELSPTLLSTEADELNLTLSLFTDDQLEIILDESIKHRDQLESDSALHTETSAKIQQILQAIQPNQSPGNSKKI